MTLSLRFTPLSDSEAECVRSEVVRLWVDLDQGNDLTGVPEDLACEKRAEVMELLQANQVSDVYRAWRLTADFVYLLKQLHS